MFDKAKLFRDFLHVAHTLRRRRGKPSMRVAPGQHRVLTLLAESGTVAQRDLGALMAISPAALSELLDKLEERELIERSRHKEDRRVVMVSLTNAGLGQAREEMAADQRIANEVFSALAEEELEQLSRILEKLEGAR